MNRELPAADRARLVIGSDNETHRITDSQQERILTRVREDFNVVGCVRGEGCHRKVAEDNLHVEVERDAGFPWKLAAIQRLRRELRQEGIGVQTTTHYLRVVDETFLTAHTTLILHRPSIVERYPGAATDFLAKHRLFRAIGDLLVFTDAEQTFDGMANPYLAWTIPKPLAEHFESYDSVGGVGKPFPANTGRPAWLAAVVAFEPDVAWCWVRNDEAQYGAGHFLSRTPQGTKVRLVEMLPGETMFGGGRGIIIPYRPGAVPPAQAASPACCPSAPEQLKLDTSDTIPTAPRQAPPPDGTDGDRKGTPA